MFAVCVSAEFPTSATSCHQRNEIMNKLRKHFVSMVWSEYCLKDNQKRYGSKVCQFSNRLQRRLSVMHKRKCRSNFINNLALSGSFHAKTRRTDVAIQLQSLPAEIFLPSATLFMDDPPKWNYRLQQGFGPLR